MRGIDVFCERCGSRQAPESREATASGGTFARRFKSAVTGTTADGGPQPTDSLYLRPCLECRGYSCPNCWNQEAAVCQTCAPLPEPDALELPQVAWAMPSLTADRAPELTPVIEFVSVAEAEPEPELVAEAEPEPELVAEAEPEPELVAEA